MAEAQSQDVNHTIQFPQKLECLFKPSRYKVLHGGRGGAKSWGVARALLLLGTQKPLRVLCAREVQKTIAESVHQLLSDQIIILGLVYFYDVKQNEIVGINGSKFAFTGLKNHTVAGLKSYEGYDVCWVEEAQAVTKRSWNVLVPTIRKEESEIWVTFNPQFEDDETYQRFVLSPPQDSQVVEINWRDNPWFPEVLDQERLALKARSADDYDHVWEGKCLKWLEGSIFANELRDVYGENGGPNRVTTVMHDPDYPVFTAWDLGRTDDTAIWFFQVIAGEIRLIDFYANCHEALSHYLTQVLGKDVTIDLVQAKVSHAKPGQSESYTRVKAKIGKSVDELKHRQAYEYGCHFLPHDARAKTLAAAGKSIIQQLVEVVGFDKAHIVPNLSVEDRIQAARMVFKRCWFDKQHTREGMNGLRRWQRELMTDDKSFKPIPKHDWASHTGDAFCYMAVAVEYEKQALKREAGRSIEVGDDNKFTLDDMWKLADKQKPTTNTKGYY